MKTSFRKLAVGLAGLLGVISASPTAIAQPKPVPRPNMTWLRYEENWSVRKSAVPGEETDIWDPIKYIPVAQGAWLSLGGSARLFYESDSHFRFGPTAAADDDFLLSRVLLHADFHASDAFRAYVQLKSAGSTNRTLAGGRRPSDVDTFEVENAFVDYSARIDATRVTLRAGRQGLLFKRRLIHTPRWPNTGRRWDGFDAIVEHGAWTAHNFWVENVPVLKYNTNKRDPGDIVFGSYLIRKGARAGDMIELYALGLNRNNVRFNGTLGEDKRVTVGGRSVGSWTAPDSITVDWEVEGARQFGSIGAFDVNAWTFSAELGLPMKKATFSPRLFVGLDSASGDKQAGGDVETFNGLYANGHDFFGYMDLIGRANAVDWYIGLSFQPIPKINVRIAGHDFLRESTRDAVYDATGAVLRAPGTDPHRSIGREIDVTVTYQLNRHTTLEGGIDRFHPGDFIKRTGASASSRFYYLLVEYTF